MNKQNTLSRPEGHHTITPGFSVKGAGAVIAFIEKAFAGRLIEKYEGPNGTVAHAEIMLGDSVVMLGEASKDHGHPEMPASLSYYVANGDEVDAAYKRAIAAGATSLMEPKNQFYGYRSATVKDVGGNRWTICAVVEQLTKEEIERRMNDLPH